MFAISPFLPRPLGFNLSATAQTTAERFEAFPLKNTTEADSFTKNTPSVEKTATLQRSGNVPQIKKMQLATAFKTIETLQVMGQFIANLHIHEGKYFAITNTDKALVEHLGELFGINESHIKTRTDFADPNKKPTYTLIINQQAKLLDSNDRQPKNRDKRTLDAYEYIQDCKDLLTDPLPIHLSETETEILREQRQWVMEGFLSSVLKGEFQNRTEKTPQLKRLKISSVPKELLPIIAEFLQGTDPYNRIANLKITHNQEAGNLIINGGAYPMIDLIRLLQEQLKIASLDPFNQLSSKSEAYANSLGTRPEIQ
jgi:hypothetical protein